MATAATHEELPGLRVLAHPLRLRMLSLLTGAPFSAAELSRELEISQALASYHLRQLQAAGVIELAEVRARRGGRERRYSYRLDPRVSWESGGSDGENLALFGEALAVELRRRSREAQPGVPRVGVDAELWIDPEDWNNAVAAIRAVSESLHEQARAPRSEGTIRVSISALLFAMRGDG